MNTLNFTKTQQTSLKNYIKTFVKKNCEKSSKDILNCLLEDLKYDFALDNSRYFWLKDYIDDKNLIKELLLLIDKNKKMLQYKESQKPYLEKQKAAAKIYRQKLKKLKQSKEKPTKKQISYYNSLCEKMGIQKADITDKSKADLIELIGQLVEKEKKNEL